MHHREDGDVCADPKRQRGHDNSRESRALRQRPHREPQILDQILDQLDRAGVYDDSLIVVVADHGIAIKPNVVHRRVILPDTVGEIAAVPLFIKRPHQTEGGIDDYRAQTTDVLPTTRERDPELEQ